MSRIKNPVEKKRIAYLRDHYNRNGESHKAWRKTKPLKKAKARRAFRKKANDLIQICLSDESAPSASLRKQLGARQRQIFDWGPVTLREFVTWRKTKREETIGARKRRKAKRLTC
jgi:hypothetical protein